MARPKRGNYAYGDAGQARYRKAVREYNAKLKKAREKKTKIDSTKKNIDKQKTANKKATTTKTTKGTTTVKPKSTAAKGKSLATGKTTSTIKAVETPKTTTATKTVNKKTTPKKVTPKKPVPKKPAGKQVAKRGPFEPEKRGPGRPKGSTKTTGKSAPKNNNTLKIKNVAKQTGNFLKDTAKKSYNLGKKGFNKIQTKLAAKDQTPQQSVPEGKSKGAKVAKGLNTKITNYAKRVYNKAALDTFKFKHISSDPSMRKANMKGVKGGLGAAAALTIGDALINRLTKPKGMTFEEWNKKKAEMEQADYDRRRKLLVKAGKGAVNLVKKGVNKLRGKPNTQTSTTQNINKQKNTNKQTVNNQNTSNNSISEKLKIAKKRVRNAKGWNKEKLEREVRYLEKFGKQGRTWSNPVGAEGNNKPSSVKPEKPKEKLKSKFIRTSKGTLARRGTATAQRAENKERARKRAQELARKRRLANR